jgi:hypothetical protein
VGWIKGENGEISFPNFERHNGETAKERALASKRQKKKRSRADRDKSVTREEKRREELSTSNDVDKAKKKFEKPTVEEVQAYCQQRKNQIDPQRFVDYYEARGWKLNGKPMASWQACVHTWEKNHGKFGNSNSGSGAASHKPGRHYDPTQDAEIDRILSEAQ